ncbi:MAG: MFS transporter [Actinomycetota bacterium]
MNRPKSDPAVFAISTEGFLSRLSFGLVSIALPLYALHLGMSVTAIGLLVSVNVMIQIAVKPLLGTLSDRFGHKRTLAVSIAARSVIPLLLVFARSPWELFAIRMIYGLAQSLRDPALNALIAVSGRRERVASTFAWYHTGKNAAASIGRAGGALLLGVTAANYALVFEVSFVLSLLPLWVVLAYVHEDRGVAQPIPGRVGPGGPTGPRPLGVFPFTMLGFLFGTTAGMLNLFPVLAKKYFGLTDGQIGLILLVSTVVIVVSGPLFGWLADNGRRNLVLLIRGIANTLSSLMYLAFPTVWGVGLSKAIDDGGKAAFRPAWGSIMAEVASYDGRRRARTMSLIDVGEDAGDALGPVLAGLLLSIGGLPVMFGVRVALALATELYASIVNRRLERQDLLREGAGSRRVAGMDPNEAEVRPQAVVEG